MLLLTWVTWVQVETWQNPETLWEHAIQVTTDNDYAHYALARHLLQQAVQTGDAELLERARKNAKEAVGLQPRNPLYRLGLGVVLREQGQLDAAAEELREGIRLSRRQQVETPQSGELWKALGTVERQQKKYDEALGSFHRALRINKDSPGVLAELGRTYWEMHRFDEAEKQWRGALKLSPYEPEALNGLGLVLLRQGQVMSAAQHFTNAVQINPLLTTAWSNRGLALAYLDDWKYARLSQDAAVKTEILRLKLRPGASFSDLASYHRRLGCALYVLGKEKAAAAEYAKASELEPDWLKTNVDQAWRLATAATPSERDALTAWELANEVCQASKEPSARALDALAAALAGLGRYDEAVKTAQRARARASGELGREIAARIELYQKRQGFVSRSE